MSRPEFLNCIMTAGIIERIRDNQAFYDKDPMGYEREQKRREEERAEEEQREHEERMGS